MSRSATPDAALRYITETFVEEDDLLRRIRAEGEARRPGMQVSAAEGKLLHVLVKLAGARRVLEIGTFVGYSSLWMARALPEGGELITLEADATHAQIAQSFFAGSDVAQKVVLHEGKALETLPDLSGPFGLVFIDAMKLEYTRYLDLVEPMVPSGGLIVGDNTFLFGAVYGEPRERTSPAALKAMQEFNLRLSNPARYDAILLPTQEGMTIARKK